MTTATAQVFDRTDVTVFWCVLPAAAAEAELGLLARGLPRGEQVRAARFRRREDRQGHLAAQALLRFALRKTLGARHARLLRDADGRAVLEDGAAALSLSHAEGLVACAVARGAAVGVDVESLAACAAHRPEQLDAVLPAAERAMLAAAAPGQRAALLARLWTQREAIGKALGTGLAAPELRGRALRVAPAGCGPDPGLEEGWELRCFAPVPTHCGAVALRRAGGAAAPGGWSWHEVSWAALLRAPGGLGWWPWRGPAAVAHGGSVRRQGRPWDCSVSPTRCGCPPGG
ncbi:4'-phosphopantetheinyl transferase family protein [Siccirubricoccus phaeus]|uniref:4'-phosphopantetheinyl transferase family protein n=1 Tax=Siccirubricoccus phaeus TaxID=2595053 RepID=UPI0011F2A18F|nr:4'-phosphopantetheinyl transferase superfamily protein [Siccirubricoccus phaeus]